MFFALVSSSAIWKMVSDVNSQLEGPQKFSYFGWYFGKLDRLWGVHRRFYPRSPWRMCFVLTFLLMLLCAFLAARQFPGHQG